MEPKYAISYPHGQELPYPHFLLGGRDPNARAAMRAYRALCAADDAPAAYLTMLDETLAAMKAHAAERGDSCPWE